MFPARSRALTVRAARLETLAHSRALNQLTMGFEEIAKWKAEKRKRTCPNYHTEKKTVFDIHIDTPSHKSTTWNISYETEASAPVQKPTPSATTSTPRHPTTRRGQTRKFTSQAGAGIYNANQLPHIQAPSEESNCPHHPIFGGERTSAQITDVPDLAVLSRLHITDTETPFLVLTQALANTPAEHRGFLRALGQLIFPGNRSSGSGNSTPPTDLMAALGLPSFFGTKRPKVPKKPRRKYRLDS
ncbi:hypothetical protein QBC34DRAFT_135867 [Podospora aff. communis PSN243]|uniref:Uncharacterized protein n=1 Tax=Podospora aff. communis PSN243 TaxID=3040156 RepID=A0AAV9H3I9_9PEZI|nr:hypothetical protein QBC34DRAFT_135867 [Podospora aff. communis PSN243]